MRSSLERQPRKSLNRSIHRPSYGRHICSARELRSSSVQPSVTNMSASSNDAPLGRTSVVRNLSTRYSPSSYYQHLPRVRKSITVPFQLTSNHVLASANEQVMVAMI